MLLLIPAPLGSLWSCSWCQAGSAIEQFCVLQGCTQGLTPELKFFQNATTQGIQAPERDQRSLGLAAAQLLLQVLSQPSSGLPAGHSSASLSPAGSQGLPGLQDSPVPDSGDGCAQRDAVTHSLAASWEVPMNISQADGASKYLFPRVKQSSTFTSARKRQKQKQTRPGPAKMSQELLGFHSIPWPSVLGRLSALKLTATG